MASLREIKRRIGSVQNTAKITHAMELVAAAKMKRAQDLANSGKPYSQLVNGLIRSIANSIDPSAHPLLTQNEGPKSLILVFSTDRGLAGPLNSNLFREIEKFSTDVRYVSLGKKSRQFLVKTGRELVADFTLTERPDLASCRPVSKLLIDGFLNGDFDQAHVLYTEFISTLRQVAAVKQLLPIIDKEILEELIKEAEEDFRLEPLFEPGADTVLAEILPQYILMEVYQIMLETKASEHSARMVSMKNATDAADELSEDLTLAYNGLRQEAITKEILDISTAAIALE
ncbi:MAG: ATP synthase F1 subunit gamma [Candidatus Woykebacteria bacterium]